MNNETLSQECMDEESGISLNFENSSDAIFANLFLKADGVSWTSFDTILSMIRNPSFDTKQVTFKNSTDFFVRIAQIREKSLLRRSRDGFEFAGIPDPILNGVFEVLGGELQHALDVVRKENHGLLPRLLDRFSSGYQSWKTTLINCALVHPSWLVLAQKALGCCHLATGILLPRAIKSPWVGEWTQELHLLLHSGKPSFRSNSCLLSPFLARLPHVRRLQLTLEPYGFGDRNADPLSPVFFDALRLLQKLEELFFSVYLIQSSFKLVPILTAMSLPNLKALRILLSDIAKFETLELPTEYLPLFSAFPSLEIIQINHWHTSSRGLAQSFLRGLSWSCEEIRHPTSSLTLSSTDLRVLLCNWPYLNTSDRWSPWKPSLPYVQRLHCDCYYGVWLPAYDFLPELREMFSFCTSLRFLSVVFLKAVKADAIGVMESIPGSIEELDVTLPTEVEERNLDSAPSLFERWDRDLAKALSQETTPHLRVFRAHFTSEMVARDDANLFMNTDRQLWRVNELPLEGEAVPAYPARVPLLPECQTLCEKRGIRMFVDALLTEEPWR